MIIGYAFNMLMVNTIKEANNRLTTTWRQALGGQAEAGWLGSNLAILSNGKGVMRYQPVAQTTGQQ